MPTRIKKLLGIDSVSLYKKAIYAQDMNVDGCIDAIKSATPSENVKIREIYSQYWSCYDS